MKSKRFSCLGYWLRINGWTAIALTAINAVGIQSRNFTALITAAFFACSCTDTFFHGSFGRGGTELLLSLPFDRRTIWRTHGWTASIFYGLLALLACAGSPLYSASTLLALLILILSHLTCALEYRYPGAGAFVILLGSGLFAVAAVSALLYPGVLASLEHNARFLASFAAANALLLIADIVLWHREGRRFVKGGATHGT